MTHLSTRQKLMKNSESDTERTEAFSTSYKVLEKRSGKKKIGNENHRLHFHAVTCNGDMLR
jgi:hypothetical protein